MVEKTPPRQQGRERSRALQKATREDTRIIVENDPETTVRRLAAAARRFNQQAIELYGGKHGPDKSDRFSVESAIGAAFQSFGDREFYPEPFEKAAAILHNIIAGHPFTDGNKRTGFLTSVLYLEQVGFPMPEELPAEVYDLCIDIASGDLRDIREISQRYQELWGISPKPIIRDEIPPAEPTITP